MRKKIAFQGTHGAYSEQAVRTFFGRSALTVPCREFETVFRKVKSAAVDFGVLPIENSLTGSIHKNYDLLIKHKVWICGEIKLRISHNLLGLPGASLDGLTNVFSHPQALSQCEGFLKKKKKLEPMPFFDTAGSAEFVKLKKDQRQAAIASVEAARIYGLKVMAEAIEDNSNNFTRFIVISSKPKKMPASRNKLAKTSIVFALKNIPGALYKALSVFALRDIDLLKIESRPIHGSPWKYMFYLDIDGAHDSESTTRAVGHLREITEYCNILGSFRPSSD